MAAMKAVNLVDSMAWSLAVKMVVWTAVHLVVMTVGMMVLNSVDQKAGN